MSNDHGLARRWQKRTGNDDIDILVYIDNRSIKDEHTGCVIWHGPLSSEGRPIFGGDWSKRAKTSSIGKTILRLNGVLWPVDKGLFRVVNTCKRITCIAFPHLTVEQYTPPYRQKGAYAVPLIKLGISTFKEFKRRQSEGATYKELAAYLRVSRSTTYQYMRGVYDTYYAVEEQRRQQRENSNAISEHRQSI